jgi:hypothetical protein
MIGARDQRLFQSPFPLGAQDGSTVAAGVEETLQLATFVTHDKDRLASYVECSIVPRFNECLGPAEVNPVPGPDFLQLFLEMIGISVPRRGQRRLRTVQPVEFACKDRSIIHTHAPLQDHLAGIMMKSKAIAFSCVYTDCFRTKATASSLLDTTQDIL